MEMHIDLNQNVITPTLKLDQQTLKSNLSSSDNDLDRQVHQEQCNLVPLGKFKSALPKQIKIDIWYINENSHSNYCLYHKNWFLEEKI